MAIKTTVKKDFNGEFEVLIKHKINNGYQIISPVVENGVKWETERQGSPGKLTFKIYTDGNETWSVQEGDIVLLRYREEGGDNSDWKAIFIGYIFTKKRSKDGWINITAYDQLRYLKNKATYTYKNKKASDLTRMIANDYGLTIGKIEDTDYVIGERVEDNQSLFDIIQNALDQTIMSTKKMYVLYADSTGICLRRPENMRIDLVINKSVAEDFEYTSTIDEETYNEIELYYDNDETKKREYFNAADSTNIGNWGRLRYTESIQNPTNAEDRVKQMLALYNRKKRTLKVTNTFGDVRCRAGASVIVDLDLGDTTVSNYMLIEKAVHTFAKDEYRMDLTLSNAEFTV